MTQEIPADFSDRMPPVLVKELRQGMRQKTFIALFVGLQVFLAVMLLSATSGSNSNNAGDIISSVIFTFFAIAMLVVQPLRGINALAGEIKDNTIEMMVLTRLSAWRIVLGKWISIVSQSALLMVTIIPYLILRYFFGGMNLVAEVMLLILMFATSMALTAVTIGLSGSSSVIVRGLLPILGLPIAMYSLLMMFFMRGFGGGRSPFDALAMATPESRIGVAVYLLAIAYLGGSMLSLGASAIAPPAENHAFLRRVFALMLLLAVLISAPFGKIDESLHVALVYLITVPAMIIAFVESSPYVAAVREPFARFGPPGKLASHLFIPTWPSGTFCGILVFILSIAAIFLYGSRNTYVGSNFDDSDAVVVLSTLGSLLFPAAWQAVFFKGDGQRMGTYILLLAGSWIACGVLAGLSQSMDSAAFLMLFVWHPLSYLAMLDEFRGDESMLVAGLGLTNILLIGLIIFRAMGDHRRALRHEQENQAGIATAA